MTIRGMDVVGFAAVTCVCGVFVARFPWPGLVWASLCVCLAHALLTRMVVRSTAQMLSDIDAEPLAVPARRATPARSTPPGR